MRRSSLAAALAIALLATPVLAQPKPAPGNPTAQAVARDMTNEAIKNDREGNYDEAIALYLKAYTIVPDPVLLSNVASSHRNAGRLKDAWKFFCKYLEKAPDGENAAYALKNAKEVQIELGNIDVDDDNVCRTTAPAPPPPPPEVPEPREPSSGSPGRGFRLTGLGLGAAGVVALGIGGYFGYQAQQKAGELNDHPTNEPWPANLKEIEREGQRAEDRQVLFMIVGGALVVGGGAVYLYGATRSSPERVTITPTATPTSAGIAISGGF